MAAVQLSYGCGWYGRASEPSVCVVCVVGAWWYGVRVACHSGSNVHPAVSVCEWYSSVGRHSHMLNRHCEMFILLFSSALFSPLSLPSLLSSPPYCNFFLLPFCVSLDCLVVCFLSLYVFFPCLFSIVCVYCMWRWWVGDEMSCDTWLVDCITAAVFHVILLLLPLPVARVCCYVCVCGCVPVVCCPFGRWYCKECVWLTAMRARLHGWLTDPIKNTKTTLLTFRHSSQHCRNVSFHPHSLCWRHTSAPPTTLRT